MSHLAQGWKLTSGMSSVPAVSAELKSQDPSSHWWETLGFGKPKE